MTTTVIRATHHWHLRRYNTFTAVYPAFDNWEAWITAKASDSSSQFYDNQPGPYIGTDWERTAGEGGLDRGAIWATVLEFDTSGLTAQEVLTASLATKILADNTTAGIAWNSCVVECIQPVDLASWLRTSELGNLPLLSSVLIENQQPNDWITYPSSLDFRSAINTAGKTYLYFVPDDYLADSATPPEANIATMAYISIYGVDAIEANRPALTVEHVPLTSGFPPRFW